MKIQITLLLSLLGFALLLQDAAAVNIQFGGEPGGLTRFRLSTGEDVVIDTIGSGNRVAGEEILVAAFTNPPGPPDGAMTVFDPIPAVADNLEIGPVFVTPGQMRGQTDDDSDTSNGGGTTNADLEGEDLWLVVTAYNPTTMELESGIFRANTVDLNPPPNDAWVFPAWSGTAADDIILTPDDIDTVVDNTGYAGASITAGTGADDGLTLFTLGTVGAVPEPSRVMLLLISFAGVLLRRRR